MTTERLPEHPDYGTHLSGADQEDSGAATLALAQNLFIQSRPTYGFWDKLTVRTQRAWLDKAEEQLLGRDGQVPASPAKDEPTAPARGHEYTRMAVAAGDAFSAEDVKDLLSHLDIAAERAAAAEAKFGRMRELFEKNRHLLPGDLCAALDEAIYPSPGPARVDLQARFKAELARGVENAAFYARVTPSAIVESAER